MTANTHSLQMTPENMIPSCDTTIAELSQPYHDADESAASDAASDAGSDAGSDASDAESETSTIIYGHEPFETFKDRMHRLCCTHWPSATANCFEVSRMAGGGFNRIIGITYNNPITMNKEEYVLRIPRTVSTIFEYELAALLHISQKTDLPVPKIVAFDLKSDNALESPYTIQHRISGTTLLEVYETLNKDQKLSLAKGIAQIIKSLQSKSYISAGRVDPLSVFCEVPDSQTKIFNFEVPPPNPPYFDGADERIVATQQPVSELLAGLIARWIEYDAGLSIIPREEQEFPLEDGLIAMARQMGELNMFKGVSCTMCHLDFEPRNILVSVPSETEVVVEGILDWDSALIGPRYAGCKVPFWLWRWEEDDDENDEMNGGKPIENPDDLDIKRAFEEAIGQDYLDLAYPRQYQIARKLFVWAALGLRDTTIQREAEEVLEEWASLYEQLKKTKNAEKVTEGKKIKKSIKAMAGRLVGSCKTM